MSRPSRVQAPEVAAGALAGAIADRLLELGMTPAHLAERIAGAHAGRSTSTTRSYVSRVLRGAVISPRLDAYLLLCHALRTDPTELARRAGLWHEPEQ